MQQMDVGQQTPHLVTLQVAYHVPIDIAVRQQLAELRFLAHGLNEGARGESAQAVSAQSVSAPPSASPAGRYFPAPHAAQKFDVSR